MTFMARVSAGDPRRTSAGRLEPAANPVDRGINRSVGRPTSSSPSCRPPQDGYRSRVADLVLLLFIAGFVRGGWSTGFLRRLIGLGYIAISLVAGAYLRQPVGALVNQFFPKIPPSYAEMLGYSIAFGVLVAVLNLVSHQVLGKVAVQGVSRGLDKVL